ncbi:unnamed protein product [Gordionus sp. m RMFG-2023]
MTYDNSGTGFTDNNPINPDNPGTLKQAPTDNMDSMAKAIISLTNEIPTFFTLIYTRSRSFRTESMAISTMIEAEELPSESDEERRSIGSRLTTIP